MRNIDYAGLYQQVLEGEKKGRFDKLTQDERTKKEINSNTARTISVKQACKGIGTGKKGVAPVAPPNLQQEEVASIKTAVMEQIAEMTNDELWGFMAFLEESGVTNNTEGSPDTNI